MTTYIFRCKSCGNVEIRLPMHDPDDPTDKRKRINVCPGCGEEAKRAFDQWPDVRPSIGAPAHFTKQTQNDFIQEKYREARPHDPAWRRWNNARQSLAKGSREL